MPKLQETSPTSEVLWNPKVKLILADVDQTIADDFMPADENMVREISDLLSDGHSLFFVTGSPLSRLKLRLTDRLPAHQRANVLVSHCSGAEVWGFDEKGNQRAEPYYSLYDELVDDDQKRKWREIVGQLVDEFKLTTYDPRPIEELRAKAGNDPFAVILEDRGPQITLEIVNGYQLDDEQRQQVQAKLPHLSEVIDLREPLRTRAEELFVAAQLPITPRFGGVFALDLALKGVSKETSVKYALAQPNILESINLKPEDIHRAENLEIWGDRFDQDAGTDWLMCAAVDSHVRAIDFRAEDSSRFPEGYNIVLWPGPHHLQDGVLEYLQARHVA